MANQNQKFDFLKHLSTICTGSILLIVTFQEKLYKGSQSFQWCIPVSIIVFLVCLSCTLGVYTLMILKDDTEQNTNSSNSARIASQGFFFIVALVNFFVGVGLLVFFVVGNYWKS